MQKEELEEREIVTSAEAAVWASRYLRKKVSTSNITYLIQYGKVNKTATDSNQLLINLKELKDYYDEFFLQKEINWKKRLGNEINWSLSFAHLREKDTTKHVHRLHPYKGKFIPQLVEYFLDPSLNHFREQIYFKPRDIVLDPFAGSGTTVIQALETGMHAIGIDVSEFNCLISSVKSEKYDIHQLRAVLLSAFNKTKEFSDKKAIHKDKSLELKQKLSEFNNTHFPISFRFSVNKNEIDDIEYGSEKLRQFCELNKHLIKQVAFSERDQNRQSDRFLDKWFAQLIREEFKFYLDRIERVDSKKMQEIMKIIVSRTARSCRATTHSDLATLKKPQYTPYYCTKHFKICTPVISIINHLKKNTLDTIRRIEEFSLLRKDTYSSIINADSRTVDLHHEVKKENLELYKILMQRKIDGIFTSPPYLGQIDYHEQHAYAYELFGTKRKDELEIGPLFKGKGKKAQEDYIKGISDVLVNMKQFLKKDANIFIVANDKFNLYPSIAESAGLRIVKEFKRPVLNRTEKDKQPYAESIFHMKKMEQKNIAQTDN